MKKEYQKPYQSLYGNEYEVVKDTELQKLSAKRQPRSTFNDGDEFTCLSGDFGIVKEDYNGNAVYSFLVKVGEKFTKFYVSWVSSTGFATYGEASTKAECKRTEEPVEGTSTANTGTFVELWQSCATLYEAKKQIAGKRVKVTINGYYHDRFSGDNPKPRFVFTLVG